MKIRTEKSLKSFENKTLLNAAAIQGGADRRRKAKKTVVLPDPRYNSDLVND